VESRFVLPKILVPNLLMNCFKKHDLLSVLYTLAYMKSVIIHFINFVSQVTIRGTQDCQILLGINQFEFQGKRVAGNRYREIQ
jgi:uncharacterized membrane protein YjdF